MDQGNDTPGRSIVVFSDGTGNSSAKAQKTNVWRLFQALDQNRTCQIARYDDGVGTSSNKYLAALGGAVGIGLKRNVIDLYKFVCRNYTPGDRIYGFGFSRGAFTIRVLVGLIAREGLVPFRSEEELIRNAAAAYRSYRTKSFTSRSPFVWAGRKLRNALLWVNDRVRGYPSYGTVMSRAGAERKDVHIHFLGLWDTVEAYGMPNVELKHAIDKVFWPLVFGDMKLSPKVRRACHALALDDERTTFHPLLWDEVEEAKRVEAGEVPAGRITQVWFAGMHSNVGGGYPEDQLSLVPLHWMMGEAVANGLVLAPGAVDSVAAKKSYYAKLYDSRSGISAYYRYSPRRIDPLFDQHGTPILPIVHDSVIMRMAYGSDAYAPVTLPNNFWVLAPDGKLLPMAEPEHDLRADKAKADTLRAGYAAAMTESQVSQRLSELELAIGKLARPDEQAIGFVWDTVFWRRCVYVLTCALTLALLAYPFSADVVVNALKRVPYFGELASTNIGALNDASRGPVATVVDALSTFIPGFLRPWKQALVGHSLEFVMLAALILASLATSRKLDHRIHYRARVAWNHSLRTGYEEWIKQTQLGTRNGTMSLLGLMLIGLAASFFVYPDDIIRRGFMLGTAVLAAILLLQAGGQHEGKRQSTRQLKSTLSLSVARWLRENGALRMLFAAWTRYLTPGVFVILLVVVGGFLLNRAVFDVANSAGAYCKGTAGLNTKEEKTGASGVTFHPSDLCFPSGLVLKEGQRYLVTITTTESWVDSDVKTDVLGFKPTRLRHKMWMPTKRWWTRNWFKPIARIGRMSNDEYALEPVRQGETLVRPMNVLQSELEARSTGELFLFVNDAVLAIPGLEDKYYRNNRGAATVEVTVLGRESR